MWFLMIRNDNDPIEELEMARKRNHKIMITEEAIEKVPLVKYKEIPESEYLTLQDLAKEVLNVSKNDNDSNEVALTYSLDHRNLAAEGKEYIGVTLGDVKFFLRNETVKNDGCSNEFRQHFVSRQKR
jgi:hypothetical protein